MLIDDAIVEFGFDCKVRKLSAKTVANYQKQLRYIEKYLKEEFQITEVEEIKPYHIKQFLAMMDDRHRKPRYINDLLKVVKTFLNYCKREGHVKSSAAEKVKNMKQPKTKILFLFGYNLYWQCIEERKTAFVGALRNSDDPSVFEKSCCGKPGNLVHEQFPSIPDFKELSSCFPEKNSTKKRVVCLAPKIIRKR